MKRTVLLLPVAALLAVLVMASCSGKRELQHTNGLVSGLKFYHDSLLTDAKVVVDDDTVVFDMSEARYINGLMMAGDSVELDYIETETDTMRAFVVLRKPRIMPAEPVKDGELLTRPARELPAAPQEAVDDNAVNP